jgi:hypothetical protein
MNDRTKRGLDCIEAALLVGVTGDALLRATPWGINVLLWTGVLALAFVALVMRWHVALLKAEGRWLVFPLVFFAAAFAWRDSLVLKSLDFLALLLVLALLGWRARGRRIRLAGMMEYVLAILVSVGNALFAFFPLALIDVRWKELHGFGWSRHVWAVVRGLLIALPIIFVFGLLFMAADAVFEGLVNKVFHVDFNTLFSHLFLILFLTWIVGGFLRGAFIGKDDSFLKNEPLITLGLNASTTNKDKTTAGAGNKGQQISGMLRTGIVEIGVVLGLLNLLFLSFVLVQIKYFFGGTELVQATTALTYSEYARRGFFELVTVATLVLPLLLAAHWLLRKDNPVHERIFRALASLQLVLLFVIMASAVGRMRLYQSEYGQTELRIYTTAFMGWLALVFVWFTLTVLRGARERFACGALVTAFLMIGLLHLINPDAMIVRTNMSLAQTGRSFDAYYAASLSADAVPTLLDTLPAASHYDQCVITKSLLRRYDELGSGDWRSWNLARAGARTAIENHLLGLREAACPQLMSPSAVSPAATVEPQRVAPASEAQN